MADTAVLTELKALIDTATPDTALAVLAEVEAAIDAALAAAPSPEADPPTE